MFLDHFQVVTATSRSEARKLELGHGPNDGKPQRGQTVLSSLKSKPVPIRLELRLKRNDRIFCLTTAFVPPNALVSGPLRLSSPHDKSDLHVGFLSTSSRMACFLQAPYARGPKQGATDHSPPPVAIRTIRVQHDNLCHGGTTTSNQVCLTATRPTSRQSSWVHRQAQLHNR